MAANFLGMGSENERLKLTGAPEFTVAVRTQLLVGQSTYAIQSSPEYAHAFSSMAEEEGGLEEDGEAGAEVVASRGAGGGKRRHSAVAQIPGKKRYN